VHVEQGQPQYYLRSDETLSMIPYLEVALKPISES
jgi:hypothetical protein